MPLLPLGLTIAATTVVVVGAYELALWLVMAALMALGASEAGPRPDPRPAPRRAAGRAGGRP